MKWVWVALALVVAVGWAVTFVGVLLAGWQLNQSWTLMAVFGSFLFAVYRALLEVYGGLVRVLEAAQRDLP